MAPSKPSQQYTTPNPESFSAYSREIYSSLHAPLFSTKPSEWESLARQKVPTSNFNYAFCSAGTGQTAIFNVAAFDRYRLRPKMLVNATVRDMSVELFGKRYSSPIIVAPIGVQKIMHPDAEEATARACREVGVPMILSTAATRTIEEVAAASGDGDRWFQLYWPKPQDDDVTASLLKRAKDNGFKVLVVTLDTFMLGWRPADLDASYLPFIWGDGCQIGHSDPVFNQKYEASLKIDERGSGEKLREAWDMMKRPGTIFGAAKVLSNAGILKRSRAWLDIMNSSTYREWKHLEILKELWNGPIVLKGIQTLEDAHRAIEFGMQGIIVSNHGGRQLDGAVASLDVLEEITADRRVKDSGLTVLFDSGIRTGSDVLKALALGAKAVLLGRPYVYGLAMGGQKGVEHVLKCMLADTDISLGNLGRTSVEQLSRHDLQIFEKAKL